MEKIFLWLFFINMIILCNGQMIFDLGKLKNLGSEISKQVSDALSPLDDLGSEIAEELHKSLEPIRALEQKLSMTDGIGGTTIVTYKPGNAKFIVKGGNTYACSGRISEHNGKCSGNLVPFRVEAKTDYCYMNIKTVVNDHICLSESSAGLRISHVNDKVSCATTDGSPYLLISVADFKDMCKNLSSEAHYKFISSKPIKPYKENNTKCKGFTPTICTFSDADRLDHFSNSNSNTMINSDSSFIG